MSDLRIKLAFGFLLLAGLVVTLSGISGQITGEGALTEAIMERLGIHPYPDTYLAVGDMLAGSYRRRAKFTATAGVVIVLAAAYGLYVSSVNRPHDPRP